MRSSPTCATIAYLAWNLAARSCVRHLGQWSGLGTVMSPSEIWGAFENGSRIVDRVQIDRRWLLPCSCRMGLFHPCQHRTSSPYTTGMHIPA